MDTVLGISDQPLSADKGQDTLGIERYCSGLTQFILRCETPMTIAIQGDWGSGKTSAMNLIQRQLQSYAGVSLIGFNTWQYSQFDLGQALPLTLLQHVAEALRGDGNPAGDATERRGEPGREDKVVSVLRSIAVIAGTVGLNIIGSPLGLQLGNEVREVAGRAARDTVTTDEQHATSGDAASDGEVAPLMQQLATLRDEFQAAIHEHLERTGSQRVAVFVDDLDRLEPRRAVEVMECLKLFLDCDRCVFVLAIDFDVVARGVEEKYRSIDGSGFDPKKSRAFFDKIIQVPFRMPVQSYDIAPLLDDYMKHFQIDISGHREGYTQAAHNSVGTNPRALKRLLNTFNLLHVIREQELANRPEAERAAITDVTAELSRDDLLLFLLLCAQAAYPEFHNALATGAISETMQFGDDTDIPPSWRIDQVDEAMFRQFVAQLIDTAENEERLQSALVLSAITSAGRAPSREATGRRGEVTPEGREAVIRQVKGDAAAALAAHLDQQLAAVLGDRIEVYSQRSTPHQWSVNRIPTEDNPQKGGRRLALVTFNRSGATIDIGQRENIPAVYNAVQSLAERAVGAGVPGTAKLEPAGGAKTVRFRNLTTNDDIDLVVGVLGEAWNIQSNAARGN